MSDKASAVSAPVCPVCQTELTRRGLVLCQKCDTPHHRRCWSYNKGCGVFGCESRVLVVPALATRGTPADPRLTFRVQAVYPDDRFGAVWALLLMGVFFWRPEMFLALLLAAVVPTLVTTTHTVNADTGMLERRRRLGPLTIWSSPSYLPLHQVECLELRRRYPGKRQAARGRHVWEVWARDAAGGETLLEVTPASPEAEVLERLEVPAEEMDTVVSVASEKEGTRHLPPGLARTLEGLPEDELAALEEEELP